MKSNIFALNQVGLLFFYDKSPFSPQSLNLKSERKEELGFPRKKNDKQKTKQGLNF